jgi:polysaccharide pyruvyl transferase WcaK-like protein
VPRLEPRVLGQWPDELGERIGYPTAPSAHSYLLAGLRGDDRKRVTHPLLLARTAALVRGARALRAGEEPRLSPAGRDLLGELRAADALLCLGAGALTSEHRPELWAQAATILAATALGLPVAVSGVTVGPFNDVADRALAALALRRARLLSVRDTAESRRQLLRLGIRTGHVRVGWDPAAALRPAPPPEVDAALASVGLPPESPFAAVNVHAGSAWRGGLNAVSAAIDALAEGYRIEAVFVPMSLHPDDNDYAPAETLRGLLREPERLRVLDPLPPDDVLLGLTARARLAVGTRYHLAVFAAAGGVPAAAIHGCDYTRRKLRGLADLAPGRVSLLGPDCTREEAVATVERLLDLPHAEAISAEDPLPAVQWLRSATTA